jgi:immune inhibitor A
MRRHFLALVLGALVLALSVGAGGSIAASDNGKGEERGNKEHDLKSPLGDKQRGLRKAALEMKLEGKVAKDAKIVQVARGQYVELAREDEDSILTVLGEFGTATDTTHHSHGGGTPGPLHNQIPQPDRTVDNTTIWAPDFSEAYYEDLLFSEAKGDVSMRNYYIEQSSNRYTVNGDVTPWVQVPFNARSYGQNYCGGIVCQDTWRFVNDSVDTWAGTMTTAAANAYLARFDVWDRYDYNGNGNFDEPDGYIDHFQSVHAGEGEETGGGAQGSDAIWSHRWYAYFAANGPDGAGPASFPAGGVRIGATNYWIGDYTIEPENGGVGVFAHEFAHDLGIPDLYDTNGNTAAAENSTGFWTIMSQGSYGSSGKPEDGIGSKPVHMGNWEKFQLGWLNYEVANPAEKKSEHKLGPAEYNTKQAQGVFVLLPDKVVPLDLGAPCGGCGSRYFYSGADNNLDNSMTKSITALAAATPLTAQVRYDIETGWDYAYLQSSNNGGTTWANLETNRSTTTNPNGQNLGFGITGDSGGWVALTATLPAGTNAVRFRYVTDGAAVEPGFQVDNIVVGATTIGTAENENEGWTFVGFRTTTGSETQSFFNAYVLANREYTGFDESLRTGPYNFGFLNTRPDWVEHFPYQDGLLIDYWNTQYTDNNTSEHPGGGLILPVDAHPSWHHFADGTLMRPRALSYDSTFGLEPTDSITLHSNGVATTIPSQPAAPVFDDRQSYWSATDDLGHSNPHTRAPGWYSVDVPKTGTIVRVKSHTKGGFMQVEVTSAK